jgi:hypothetical protein
MWNMGSFNRRTAKLKGSAWVGSRDMKEVPQQTEGAGITPHQHPVRRRLGMSVLLLALVLVLGGAFLALTGRPLALPEFVVAQIEARANKALAGQARAELGSVVLVVDRRLVPHVALRDVTLYSAAGQPLAFIPDVRSRLSQSALLSGRIVPEALTLSGARVALRRLVDGSLNLSLGDTSKLAGAAMTPAQILDGIDAAFAAPGLATIRTISVDRLEMRLYDDRTAQVWQVTDGTLNLAQNARQIGIGLGLNVAEAGLDPARVEVSFLSIKDTSEAELYVRVRDMNSRDLAAQSPALAWLSALDTRLSGKIRTGLTPDGQLQQMTASLDLGPGALRPSPQARPVGFKRARVEMNYHPALQRLDFTELSVDSPALRVQAVGQAWMQNLRGAFPTTLVAQVQIRDLKADPEGLFESPVGFSQGALDLKVDLDPFRLTIGQFVLADAGRHISLDGEVVADERGWSVATDVAIDAITSDRLLALWPVLAVPKTRSWLAENVATGELFDVKAALRATAGQEPRLSLGYEYRAAEVRFLRTLPPVQDGEGFATINDYGYTLVVDRGHVTPPQGGQIDVAGTIVEVPDIRIKPAPARITLRTESTITAALALLDEPPFRFLSKAGRPVDQAEGRARLTTVLEMILEKKISPEDVSYDVNGTLADVSSDVIVPGRPLRAARLDVHASRAGLKISGAGTLSAIPFDAEWSQGFAPDHKGKSHVEGRIELSPAFIKAFGIGLPAGIVTGKGSGRIALDLVAGAKTAFRMTSDLTGITLSLPAVGYSKPAGRAGSFAIEGALGQPPEVTALQLDAAGLKASGRVTMKADSSLERAAFDQVSLGDWFKGSVDFNGRGKGRPAGIAVTGGRLDLRKAPFGKSGEGGASEAPLSVALDHLQVTQGIGLDRFAGDFSLIDGFRGNFSGLVNGVAPVSGVVAPMDGRAAFRIGSQDAGSVMRAAGMFTKGRGGVMDLILNPEGGEGRYRGRIEIRNLRVVNAPVLAELLGAISVVGLLEQLNGSGLLFGKVQADFRVVPGAIEVSRGSAVGASLGVSGEGVYRTETTEIDMQGTISPIYLLNGIGQIFSRRGEGLFGFNYRLKGPSSAIRVSVNPLSILTPGMFREIFRADPPRADQ